MTVLKILFMIIALILQIINLFIPVNLLFVIMALWIALIFAGFED